MKKIVLIIVVILIVIFLSLFLFKYSQKKSIEEKFDNYISSQNYSDDVLRQKIEYDSKIGTYYVVVFYKKYPDREYTYYFFNGYVSGSAIENEELVENAEYLEGTIDN